MQAGRLQSSHGHASGIVDRHRIRDHYHGAVIELGSGSVSQRPCPVTFPYGRYEYDFGAAWNHTIMLERVLDRAVGVTHPVCVAGRGDAPVEDWTGGPETTPFDRDVINGRLVEFGAQP